MLAGIQAPDFFLTVGFVDFDFLLIGGSDSIRFGHCLQLTKLSSGGFAGDLG